MSIRALTDEMIAAMHRDIGALGVRRRRTSRAPPTTCRRCWTMIGQLQAQGPGLPGARRRRELRGAQVSRATASCRASRSTSCAPASAWPCSTTRRTRWTSCCGRRPSPTSPPTRSGTAPDGPGRPGWHIECSAMSCATAGRDLRHPRRRPGPAVPAPRERDRAERRRQRRAGFARYWLHNGFLNVDDEKMSKSLGNFFTIADVLQRFDGETLRFFMLRTHYRSPFNFSDANLDDARSALRRLYTALDGCRAARRRPRIDWAEPRRRPSRPRWTTTSTPRARWRCCSSWPAEVNRGDAAAAALLQAPGRRARHPAAAAARLPAGRRRARRGGDPGAASRRAPRPSRRATSPPPTASATSLLAAGHRAAGLAAGHDLDRRGG